MHWNSLIYTIIFLCIYFVPHKKMWAPWNLGTRQQSVFTIFSLVPWTAIIRQTVGVQWMHLTWIYEYIEWIWINKWTGEIIDFFPRKDQVRDRKTLEGFALTPIPLVKKGAESSPLMGRGTGKGCQIGSPSLKVVEEEKILGRTEKPLLKGSAFLFPPLQS